MRTHRVFCFDKHDYCAEAPDGKQSRNNEKLDKRKPPCVFLCRILATGVRTMRLEPQ